MPTLVHAGESTPDTTGQGSSPAVKQGTWSSAAYGTTVMWDAPWTVRSTGGSTAMGYEAITHAPDDSPDLLILSTNDIASTFSSAKEYLALYDDRSSQDMLNASIPTQYGVHIALHDRTDRSLTTLFFYKKPDGLPMFQMNEHRVSPDSSCATHASFEALGEHFVAEFTSAQSAVRVNGSAPFVTVETGAIVELANRMLEG